MLNENLELNEATITDEIGQCARQTAAKLTSCGLVRADMGWTVRGNKSVAKYDEEIRTRCRDRCAATSKFSLPKDSKEAMQKAVQLATMSEGSGASRSRFLEALKIATGIRVCGDLAVSKKKKALKEGLQQINRDREKADG